MGPLYPATLALVLMTGSYTSAAFSQDSDSPETKSSQESTRSLEEITVVGERSILSIRYQIRREEDAMYRLFNDLNSDDEFDIKCRMVKRYSHIARRECEPKFFTRARSANALMGMADMRSGLETDGPDFISMERGLSLLQSESELGAQEGNKFEAMSLEMLRLAMENPAYMNSLLRIDQLNKELEATRKEKFGK